MTGGHFSKKKWGGKRDEKMESLGERKIKGGKAGFKYLGIYTKISLNGLVALQHAKEYRNQ